LCICSGSKQRGSHVFSFHAASTSGHFRTVCILTQSRRKRNRGAVCFLCAFMR
jgi:hypothetical protein